ncbi:G8 domain-containing protein [Vibrio neptunius]|uniref:G8 domain-containing protein n=1 Tax=Vibrio neptunius TaxID=170651 RepID=UPI001C5CAE10|nr:G8 domain-containing protein [Vibrio neptunius]QXX08805.1 G8 domain-containing protein [Vibrio neptunius]
MLTMSRNILVFIAACVYVMHGHAKTPMEVAGTATVMAVSSGPWTSPATWGGVLPIDDDRVLIPNGITVTVDGLVPEEFKSITIGSGGKLDFATDSNTELRTEYLFGALNSQLEIGTSNNGISKSVTASLVFAERGGTSEFEDPQRYAPGAVLMGSTKMYGASKTSWLTLAKHLSTGATELVLSSTPNGWQVGDRLVIAGTDPITNASRYSTDEFERDEVVTITHINGDTVSFTPALVRDHKAPSQKPDLNVHVANLSRNIVISSENTSVKALSGEFQKPRGHLMFMHTLDVDMRYVEANNLGRTDKSIILDDWDFSDLDANKNTGSPVNNGLRNPRGRYSIHFHRGGLDTSVFPAQPKTPLPTPAHVEGCVVNNDPGWGYVNHSSRVNFVRNVSYSVVGGAFNTESGNETGSFIENIAIRTVNPSNPIMVAPRPRNSYFDGETTQSLVDLRESRQDFAWQGDGFWFHSTGVKVEGNVVSGASGHAYVYWTEGLVEKELGMARGSIDAHVPASEFPVLNQELKAWKRAYPNFVLDVWYLKPRPFKNNTAYNFARGVQTYYTHTEFHRKISPAETDPNSWMNDLPPMYKDQLNMVFDGTTLWNIGRVGFEHNHSANITIQNSKIYGFGARTGFEDYGENPLPAYVNDEPEVIGLDLDYYHNTHRWTLSNNQVEGFSGNAIGISLPKNAQVTIDGGIFNNSGTDIQVNAASEHLVNENGEGFGVGMLSTAPTQSTILVKGNIVFKTPKNNIVMDAEIIFDEVPQKGFPMISGKKVDPLYFFAPQEVLLDFEPFFNARAYFDQQDGGYTPLVSGSSGNLCAVSEPEQCVEYQYADKTNRQLKSEFKRSFLGEITPESATLHKVVSGGKVSGITL